MTPSERRLHLNGAMVKCLGCGFHCEAEFAREEVDCVAAVYVASHCLTCQECEATPKLREAYRRGFNAGLDAMAGAVKAVADGSALRKNQMVNW